METATAAVGSALRRLQAYLSDHDDGHRCDVERLGQELASIRDRLLLRAAQAPPPPPGQLIHDEEPSLAWAGEARELAYDAEDAVDGLLATPLPPPGSLPSHPIKELLQKAAELAKSRHRSPDVAATPAVIDRYCEQQLPPDGEGAVVGVDDARDRLIRRLRLRDEAGDGDDPVQVVSLVGSPGLGKTTLAGAAFGVLKPRFDGAAFVSVGLDPDVPEVLESAVRQLGVDKEADAGERTDEEQLIISQLRGFLQNKRYFIILDDLWDRSSWEKIRCALPDNNLGSRIVTTTRNLDLAGEVGETYELKPLSSESSKRLFFRTIFGSEDKCPDDEFTEVADKILEKCGGVPLAVITLAKLLANSVGDKTEWHKVCKSIGPRLENTPDVKNMRTAVSTGYYNLLPHLRACLLYMSIFPENCEIRRDRLIWQWIAEGFIQPGEQCESLFQLGENYYDELVNRSMIMPLDIDYADDGGPYEPCCRVSFPVMDFITCLSSQENFVAVLDGEQRALPSDVPVRRVSVRGGSKAEDSASLGTVSVPQLRSLSAFSPATAETIIDLDRFGFLRVLDLEGCDLSESRLLQRHLGNLIHLRYLGLRETGIVSVPEEIGNLKFLQTLDLDENLRINELPASVTQLRELICLHVYWQTRLPSGMSKLTALEELSDATTRDSPELVRELGTLTRLRTLRITLWNPSRSEEEALVESLRGLRELRTLDVYVAGGDGGKEKKLDALREAWAPPPCLREFRAGAPGTAWGPMRHLPSWLLADADAVPRLAVLVLQVAELRQRDVDALGRLPALRVLRLEPDATTELLHVAGGAFPRLTELRLRDADVAPVFRPGAMPRLRRLEVCIRVRRTVDLGNGAFEFGWENLASLEEAAVYVGCQEAWETETDAAEAALRRAADGHPNRASFDVITFGEELMCFEDLMD